MHLLVTGISGFLGRHVVSQALEQGHTVTAIVRAGDKRKYDGVQVIGMDLTGDVSVPNDIDVVIHCAADTNMSPRKIKSAWSFNTTGTLNLARASKAAGVKRFVYISTATTYGWSKLPYVAAKLEMEHMLYEEYTRNFSVIVINPSFILGPGDVRSGSTRLIKAFVNNRIILHTGGGKQIVDVRDVASAILRSVTLEYPMRQYMLANQSMSYRQIIDVVDRSLDRRSLKIKMPKLFWTLIGYSGTALSFLRSRGSTLNHLTMKLALEQPDYSSVPARVDLNFRPRSPDETIVDTVKWIKQQK